MKKEINVIDGANALVVPNILTEKEIREIEKDKLKDKKSQKLAGFDPNQKRNPDGTWGDGGGDSAKKDKSETPKKNKISNQLEKEFPKLTIDIYQNDKKGVLTLSRVIVPEDLRGQGIGTEFMESLTEKADKLGYSIILTPSEDFGGNKNRLVEFYKRFGFVLNKGANRDFSHREDMYRLPKK